MLQNRDQIFRPCKDFTWKTKGLLLPSWIFAFPVLEGARQGELFNYKIVIIGVHFNCYRAFYT